MTTEQSSRTPADVEAELASIDTAAKEQSLAQDKPQGQSAGHDYEYEARRKGWRPEAEYAGPEDKWVDAKTFVERGERFTKKLEGTIADLTRKIESFEGTKAQFRTFFDEQMAKRDREHAEAISNLRVQRSQAIREGDDNLAIELEDRIEATREQQKAMKASAATAAAEHVPAATSPTPPGEDNPVLTEWVADGNSWFRQDDILTKHALSIGEAMRKSGETLTGRAFLDKVTEKVKSDFPRRFKSLESTSGQRQTSTEGSTQSGAGTASSGTGGKTERDLPAADLAIMRQFVKDGLYTKEQFLKSYFSRNG